jgi:RNA polymerase sigma-70 factor, ECF subfamily
MESHDVAVERRAQELAVTAMSRTRRRVTVDRDADLAERLCRHEPGATEALVAVYGDRVYRLAIGITGNRSDAEEVVQDALWTVVRRIETFRGDAAFASWVYRISVNAAYQKRRARRVVRNEMSWDDLGLSFEETGAHVHPDSDWSPRLKDPALQAELQSVLCTAIDELPAGHRTIFLLHDVEGLSNRVIAGGAAGQGGHHQVPGAPGPALFALPPGCLRGPRRSGARRRWWFHIGANSPAIAATRGASLRKA